MNRKLRFQVVIVGGGPAGLATAIALQQSGFECAVFDGQHPPVDKACGEGLMPDALAALGELGVSTSAQDGYNIQGICFHAGVDTASATFPGMHGIGMRRTRLHHLLVNRAERLGVHLFWDAPVSLTREHLATVHGQALIFDWLVLADGYSSALASKAGFPPARAIRRRVAARQHYAVSPWSDLVEVYWGKHKQIYVTPVGENEVGVALLGREQPSAVPSASLESALAEFPTLAERLRGAPVTSRMRGAITSNRSRPEVFRGRVILIGDTSGSVDAITGEGLAVAFRQALLLAQALRAGNLGIYEAGHRKLQRTPLTMAQVLLALDRWPALRRVAMHALAQRPELFSALLEVHIGHCSLTSFTVRHGRALLGQIVRSFRSDHIFNATAQASRLPSPTQQQQL